MISYLHLDKLKGQIRKEIISFTISDPVVFSDENIELFLRIVTLPLADPAIRLEGLQTRVPNALTKILLDEISDVDRASFFPEIGKIEPFLQKILYLVNEPEYRNISSARAGLAKCIDKLGLNPNNLHLSTAQYSTASMMPSFAVHVLRAYNLRNLESHKCLEWPKKELYENMESILVVYVYAISLHAHKLKTLLHSEPDFGPYLNSVVTEFEIWQRRFVHITGQEEFEEVSIHAVETDDWDSQDRKVLREGKIDDLRKSIEEKAMIVLGEPGMGKSTTLQYMAYYDAKFLLNSGVLDGSRIPVYVELKQLSKTDTIFSIVANRLNITDDKLAELLTKGRITLFLDGLNEVLQEIRKPIRQDIQNLVRNYTNLAVIVTSRPLAYSNEFKGAPVFVLQKMEDNQIDEFLSKNCQHKLTEEIIKKEIQTNNRFGKIVRVPLLLKMLITVVRNNRGVIPQNKAQIIKFFIESVYEREKEKNVLELDLRVIHRLLCFLGFKTRQMNESNVSWRVEEMESIIEKRIERSRFTINAFQFLDLAVDLNLLVRDNLKYSFIHELYQEYFASEEIFRLKVAEND